MKRLAVTGSHGGKGLLAVLRQEAADGEASEAAGADPI